MSTIVNAFPRAGIYPVNGNMVKKGGTRDPAKLHCESSDSSQVHVPTGTSESDTSERSDSATQAVSSLLKAIEAIMEPATVKKHNDRYSEGYNVSGDELYNV